MASLVDTSTSIGSGARQHGLDALRAAALLLGIVLHSLLPFVPGLPWLVNDSRSSSLTGIPVYVIHLFRMVLFMLLAGYFGRMVVQRSGASRYLRDRVVRVLLPLVVFWPVAVLSLGILAVVNAQVHGLPLVPPPPPSGPPLLMINPGQLWFLLVLMQCVVVVLVGRALGLRVLGPERSVRFWAGLGRLLTTPGGLLVAAIPYIGCLLWQGTVLGGIRAPETLLPSGPALTAYLGAFLVGWALHAQPDSLARVARFWPAHLGLALALSGVGLLQTTPGSTTPLPVAATVAALAGWCWVYGLLGLCVRFLVRERPAVRYLADASYWMYLVHLPLLVAFEIVLVALDWPIALKLAVTWLVVGAVLLLSYALLVRSTPVGRWLNGRRHPSRWPWQREPGLREQEGARWR